MSETPEEPTPPVPGDPIPTAVYVDEPESSYSPSTRNFPVNLDQVPAPVEHMVSKAPNVFGPTAVVPIPIEGDAPEGAYGPEAKEEAASEEAPATATATPTKTAASSSTSSSSSSSSSGS